MINEMKQSEMMEIYGGGWSEALAAMAGGFLIGIAPAVGVATGIGASAATPAVGIAAGVSAYAGVSAAGAACLDYACR